MLDTMVTPADLEGALLGPVAISVTADRIAFYAEASGDVAERWTTEAPPGFASVLLFAVADLFLRHEKVVPFTATLLHLDQSFAYHAPMRAGSTITMEGTITRVRERSGSYFVTFESVGRDEHGDVVSATSTFVLSDRAAPGAEVIRTEPAARERSRVSGDQRSASRHDLVRYAAATRDFNPLHWDHDVAVAAGLSGTVVHGLLMYAWMMQSAIAATDGRDVLAATVRFRAALHPAETASLDAVVEDDRVRLELTRDGVVLVTGTASVAAEE